MSDTQLTASARADETDGERVAREISRLARELAAETERGRRLPDQLVVALRDSGLMRAGAPVEVEGAELPPGTVLGYAEEVARGDASAGWCVSIAVTSSLLAAYLPPEGREELFGGGRGVASGVWAPRGKARAVDGGLVVSGQWAYCSGISHADVMFAGCFVEGDAPTTGERPLPSVVALRREDLQILDTWHTLGLRGTGSHDTVADEVFVPSAHVLSLFDGPVVERPLYRFPPFGFFALSIAAAALGNARAAIEAFVELAAGKVGLGSTRTLAERSPTQAATATADASLNAARAFYYEAIEAAWRAAQREEPVAVALRNQLRLAATHAVRTSAEVTRTMYDLAGGSAIYDDSPLQRHFRDAHTATAHFQVNEASRELPGRILLGQAADPLDAVSGRIEAALPFWLDRPDEEALEIALEVSRTGLGALWIGELVTFDAIALATAIGDRAPGLRLKLGPLAIGVRTPVAIALGVSSVATLTGSEVDVALGASSPAIVSAWHDREWAHSASRMRETIACLRAIFAGGASDHDGDHVHSHGFRLRRPRPDTSITVAAFGPAMTRVAARHADEVVLNLVPPERVRAVREIVDIDAAAAGRTPPRLAVWVPVALEPGEVALTQLASQLTVYLAPPGYGEMFAELGFSELVRRAREGARRGELADAVPLELLAQVCALGSLEQLRARLDAYYDAGADTVAVVPSTAEDPGGRAVLAAVSEARATSPTKEHVP